VAAALLVALEDDLVLLAPGATRARRFPRSGGSVPGALPPELRSALRGLDVRVLSAPLQSALSEVADAPVALATVRELRDARASLPERSFSDRRSSAIRSAHRALERALRSPEEILITLTREEERLERAVGREERAGESFLAIAESPLATYESSWKDIRATLRRHHAALEELVRTHARTVVPNLAAVVGERTAARLVSAAGGVGPLARMRAGRIQLLGTRRRPSPERGPRYGIVYRADGMDRVPPARRGAYARSLGALAAIAVRADASTRSPIGPQLVVRRDRRIAQLRGGK
jgi:hypothetical protein